MSRCALSENGIAYYAITYCFGDIRVRSGTILLSQHLFDILIGNISSTIWTSIHCESKWKNNIENLGKFYSGIPILQLTRSKSEKQKEIDESRKMVF